MPKLTKATGMLTSALAAFRASPVRFTEMCTMGGSGAPLPSSFSHGVTKRSPTGNTFQIRPHLRLASSQLGLLTTTMEGYAVVEMAASPCSPVSRDMHEHKH